MTKKYNPKQTVEKILSTSAALFMEKGYDKTSMQDIVNALGMSKGAIFHHFKSKEDVLNAVMEEQFRQVTERMRNWLAEAKELTAKEKLSVLLMRNLTDDATVIEANNIVVTMTGSPQLILAIMQGNLKKSAPIMADILREGIEDGSITTAFPDECAEVFLLLINIWCDTYVFEGELSAVRKRLEFLQTLMRQVGADIVTDEIIEATMKAIENLNLEVAKWTTQSK